MLTQRQLALRLGVASSTLSRYESGRGQPSLRMLDQMLAGCGKELHPVLVQRHADLDAELDRLAALTHSDRLQSLGMLTCDVVRQLPDQVVIGGAWAAALHGLPHEHDDGRLGIPDDEQVITRIAAVLSRASASLWVDGQATASFIRVSTFARHPVAHWRSAVPAEDLEPGDGVRPDVLARWTARRAGRAA